MIKNFRFHSRMVWVIVVGIVLTIFMYLIGTWPAGLIVPLIVVWVALRHGEDVVTVTKSLMRLPGVTVTEVKTPPISPPVHSAPNYEVIDHDAERQETWEKINQLYPVEIDPEEPIMEELPMKKPIVRLDEYQAGMEQQSRMKKVAALMHGGTTDRRTLASKVYGEDTKENREKVDELISEIVGKVVL